MTILKKLLAAASILLFLYRPPLPANWICRSDSATPVSINPGNQWNVRVTPDGQSGSVMVWQDRRSGAEDKLFVQRMSSAGNPIWQPGGIQIASTAGYQYYPQIVGDGAGGAFIAWQDNRFGADYDIFVQKISAGGLPLWTPNGLLVCNAAGNQYNPQIVADGLGGVIVVWQDKRSGGYDIYAQHVTSAGDVLWPSNGQAVCTSVGDQIEPKLASDGQGGALIFWSDYRAGTGFSDIYGQRVLSNGQRVWADDGTLVCGATNTQWNLQVVSDGASGAIAVWQDRRSGILDNIYAQRLDNSGTAKWGENGIPVAPALGIQYYPAAAADGSGGVVVTWQDNRRGSDYDIFAQRVSRDGLLLWSPAGKPVCMVNGQQYNPQVVVQRSSAVIVWQDHRLADFDIYAQRFSLAGDPQWDVDGTPVATSPYDQFLPQLCSDGYEGAIIAWPDYQRGAGTTDLFAQRMGANGKPAGGCFRTINQAGYAMKPMRFKSRFAGVFALPNEGNVRDSIFGRGIYPNGIYLGIERLDSAKRYGWQLFTKRFYVRKAFPQNGTPRPFDRLYERFFVGLMKNPSALRYNNRLSAELLALKLNIAASDLGITPNHLGELVFVDEANHANPIHNKSLRQITGYVDSILTFWRARKVDYIGLYSWLSRINNAFVGPVDTFSTNPLALKPVGPLFALSYLVPGAAPPPIIPDVEPQAVPLVNDDAPSTFSLSQNYPNPFNPVTTIEFTLPEPMVISFKVYNTLGQQIAVLLDRASMDQGRQLVDFDGSALSSGVYFYQLYAEDLSQNQAPRSIVRKMLLLK